MSKGPTTMGEGVGAALPQAADPQHTATHEALPQAPAPAEVAHPAPDQNERAALLRDIHTLIREQLREYCARGKGGLAHSPEMLELYSSSAKAIMSYDLDIPAETDTETPRRWVGEYKGGP
ncbi:unnamed protein product [Prunus armeniaca]|uniref:Uncharacterized protein n=1 Tax=Prunus armeniaca TaxID=36596 RepID=A0A6J5THS7_PRUAR|nr:unnamed protein product [Prunus armeniaca]CAB4289979.1 unnamed protein product [Prunus armeniaca]CAB4320343.1 unnamed protein product [Prunus armeniaca]